MRTSIECLLLSGTLLVGCADGTTAPTVVETPLEASPTMMAYEYRARGILVAFGGLAASGDDAAGGIASCAEGDYLNESVATGQGTHLGEFALHMHFCEASGSAASGGYTFYNGRSTYTALNGDELWTEWATVPPHSEIIVGHDGVFSHFYIREEIVGGTGRFAEASGWIETEGRQCLDPPSRQFRLTGSGRLALH